MRYGNDAGQSRFRKTIPLNNNNNRNNNNRRRGRNNPRQQGGGGINQNNRIDNRARGNAAQMLDKYKKLASDAALNDDRVQQEYYLQFADHYFRVIADNKALQDEERAKREGNQSDRSDNSGDESDDRGPRRGRGRGQRDDGTQGGRDQKPRGRSNRDTRDSENGSGDRDDNPFTRDERAQADQSTPDKQVSDQPKAEKPRTRRPRKVEAAPEGELDMAVLPPAIGGSDDTEEAPKKVRKPRARKPAADKGDSLEAVG